MVWILFLAAAPGAIAAGQEYLIKNWTTADGIPHNTVRAIVESRNGYPWLGTANGIARFDGVGFKFLSPKNSVMPIFVKPKQVRPANVAQSSLTSRPG